VSAGGTAGPRSCGVAARRQSEEPAELVEGVEPESLVAGVEEELLLDELSPEEDSEELDDDPEVVVELDEERLSFL